MTFLNLLLGIDIEVACKWWWWFHLRSCWHPSSSDQNCGCCKPCPKLYIERRTVWFNNVFIKRKTIWFKNSRKMYYVKVSFPQSFYPKITINIFVYFSNNFIHISNIYTCVFKKIHTIETYTLYCLLLFHVCVLEVFL